MSETHIIDGVIKTGSSAAHDGIASVGGEHAGRRWRDTQQQAIDNIKSRRVSCYVAPPNGPRVAVIIGERNGREYLKTANDGEQPNNLLSLRSCG
ncbi:DUF3892 domain-containing protein [Chondromyces apiculatus]|uniref:DUF3892 domain-containing protein n=1 Tax=Chondromyces apiculatus DSM 436 TaxID=1192034 RepID=A0A017T8N3_9BACT|nr:DUF3892 domain-containing protein [Chondromyces apiculatus]EYF05337.1 Hypothetical protein CAP_3254 [Chondromyces apiculatus DSM 436]